jgi:hypothetical protein
MKIVREYIDYLSPYDFECELRSVVKMLEKYFSHYENFESIEVSYDDSIFKLYGSRPETDDERLEREKMSNEQQERLEAAEYANFLRLKKKFEGT